MCGSSGTQRARLRRGATDHWIEVSGGNSRGRFLASMEDLPTWCPPWPFSRPCVRTDHHPHVAHLRIKESNRLEALVRELAKTGIRAEEPATACHYGGTPRGAEIETYNDHGSP